jgi:hypothetical protein
MTSSKRRQLAKLLDADYLTAQSHHRQIASEELRLRSILRDLDTQEKAGRTRLSESPAIKTIGADVIWYRWVSLTRDQLNTELAMVMARKGAIQEAVREKGGRASVMGKMSQDSQRSERRQRQLSDSQALEQLFALARKPVTCPPKLPSF